jgi:ankyrin repeat protein
VKDQPPATENREAHLPEPQSPATLYENTLFDACKQGLYEETKALLEERPRVNLQDSDGWSALMCACQEGHLEVAELLLENGAAVDLQNSKGWSALMLACRAGHYGVVKLLLEHGADINLQSLNWESAYSVAVLHEDQNSAILIEKVSTCMQYAIAGINAYLNFR